MFADEIVVVLDKCNDNSYKIIKKYTNQIFSGNWDIESERRNYGLDKWHKNFKEDVDIDVSTYGKRQAQAFKLMKKAGWN